MILWLKMSDNGTLSGIYRTFPQNRPSKAGDCGNGRGYNANRTYPMRSLIGNWHLNHDHSSSTTLNRVEIHLMRRDRSRYGPGATADSPSGPGPAVVAMAEYTQGPRSGQAGRGRPDKPGKRQISLTPAGPTPGTGGILKCGAGKWVSRQCRQGLSILFAT